MSREGTAKKGFTLTELLTTVGTIGVLASMFMPSLMRMNRPKDSQCLVNQRNLSVNLQGAFMEVRPDYSGQVTDAEEKEIAYNFMKNYAGPVIPDPFLKDLGVYVVKSATCPYAFGDGKKRAVFGFLPRAEQVFSENTLESTVERKYLTSTYRMEYDDRGCVVWDSPNYNQSFEIPAKDMLRGLTHNETRSITFNDDVLHPHKGIGSFVTWEGGEQEWLNVKSINKIK